MRIVKFSKCISPVVVAAAAVCSCCCWWWFWLPVLQHCLCRPRCASMCEKGNPFRGQQKGKSSLGCRKSDLTWDAARNYDIISCPTISSYCMQGKERWSRLEISNCRSTRALLMSQAITRNFCKVTFLLHSYHTWDKRRIWNELWNIHVWILIHMVHTLSIICCLLVLSVAQTWLRFCVLFFGKGSST